MTIQVVLLRGVNVGGGNKVPMARLRERLVEDGFADVRTYIQSGNVVLDAGRLSSRVVCERVRAALREEFSVDVPVVSVTAAGLREVVDNNPYPDFANPKFLHAMFLAEPVSPDAWQRIERVQAAQQGKGSPDSVTLLGSVLYLSTPDGFGTSELAKALTTKGKNAINGTARNWTTVTTLLEMASD